MMAGRRDFAETGEKDEGGADCPDGWRRSFYYGAAIHDISSVWREVVILRSISFAFSQVTATLFVQIFPFSRHYTTVVTKSLLGAM